MFSVAEFRDAGKGEMQAMATADANENTDEPATPRVLVAHDDVGTLRLIRETLGQFGECEIDTSPTAEYAYELALQRDYALFMFGLGLPVLNGELLYELLAKAYPFCHSGAVTCPGVVYIVDPADAGKVEGLQRQARVKGVLVKPLSIDRILDRVKSSVKLRDQGASFSGL